MVCTGQYLEDLHRSDFLSKGNVRHPRLVYSTPVSMISLMVLRAHELNYLSFDCRGKQLVMNSHADQSIFLIDGSSPGRR